MKCLVLAGGNSERFWPLSRNDYPKQFMELREGRSMFQETILRNMPFCDEFIILTNRRYENVARAQLQVFQGLEYKLVLEDVPLKTAPPVYLVCKDFEGDEELLITPSDSIINGDYNAAASSLKEAVKHGKFAAIVCKPKNYGMGYNYLKAGKKVAFGEKPSKGCLWDTGIWGAKVSVLLAAFNGDFVRSCKPLKLIDGIISCNETENFNPVSLIKVIFSADTELIFATFEWARITDISSYYRFYENFENGDKNAAYAGGKYFIDGECDFSVMEASFQCFVILDGEGTISDGVKQYKITRGDTWFCASRVQVTITGKCRLLAVNI